MSAESETKAKALVEKMAEAKTAIKEVCSIHTIKDDAAPREMANIRRRTTITTKHQNEEMNT